MILIKCVNAYAALQGMMDKEWDYQTAYALVMLKKRLYPHVCYYQQEEMKLVQTHAAKDEDGKILWSGEGTFTFRSPEDGIIYTQKRRELDLVEVQEDFSPIKVNTPSMIIPVHLEALEGFLTFGEVGNDGL